MSDRLKDLQRQRALAQEQLAWLDREIARESAAANPPAPAPRSSMAPHVPPAPPATAGLAHAEAEAEAMLAQYRNDPDTLQSNVKRGCYIYFLVAMGLLVLTVLAFYYLHQHR